MISASAWWADLPGRKCERAVQEVRLEDRLHDQQHRHLHHAVPDRRDAEGTELAVGLGNVHALHRLRAVGVGLERLCDLAQEPHDAVGTLLHLFDAQAVHARGAAIGGHQVPCRVQNVGPAHRFVQRVEAEGRFPLGFEV